MKADVLFVLGAVVFGVGVGSISSAVSRGMAEMNEHLLYIRRGIYEARDTLKDINNGMYRSRRQAAAVHTERSASTAVPPTAQP